MLEDEHPACIAPETLAAYVDGALTAHEYAAVEAHVAVCGSCRMELSAAAATRTSDPAAASSAPTLDVLAGGPSTGRPLEVFAGASLGRYRVVRELGRGAMGVVVQAHDPELHRDVALKVLLPRLGDGRAAREHLRREAQAMAMLSHPNVVRVYDVMTEGERLAIAMELVSGGTLRTELRRAPGPRLLAACVRAGRGLAAAHRGRLVHRDFKPENVLCADDGRVLVSDFGLARAEPSAALVATDAVEATAMAGTPAYLAPEVWAGGAATAASDQFAWAVTTYEALTGRRPFVGETVAELCHAIARGEVQPWPNTRGIPGRVRAAIRRALSVEPTRRFPTMDALLAAVAPPRRSRLVIAAVVVAVAVSAALWLGRRPRPGCSDQGLFAWRRAELVAALGDGPATARVVAALDGYERTWRLARRESCEATRVRGELSEQILAARLTCLDRGHRQFVELTELVTRAPTLAAQTVEAATRLPDPFACTPTVDRLELDPAVERARAVLLAGEFTGAAAQAEAVIARRPSDGVLAQALLVRGQAEMHLARHREAEVTLSEAVVAAERAHLDQLVGEIWVELMRLAGPHMHRFEAATANQRAVEAAFARTEPGPSMRLTYASVVGATLLSRGEPVEARRVLERALDAEAEVPPYTRGSLLSTICAAGVQIGDLVAARAACEQAIALLVDAVGPDHSTVIESYNSLGMIALSAADTAGALNMFEKVVAPRDAPGASPHILALAYANIGVVRIRMGELGPARAAFTRSIELFDEHLPEHVQRTLPLQGLATIELAEGHNDAAIDAYQAALAISERAYGPDDPRTLAAMFNVVLTVERSRDDARALALARELAARARASGVWPMVARALALEATILARTDGEEARAIALRFEALAALDRGDDAGLRAEVDAGLGEALHAAGRIAEAVAPLERAVAYYRADNHPFMAATTRFTLGQALWTRPADRRRALALVAEAAQLLAPIKPAGGPQVEGVATAIEVWLREHRD